MGAKEEDEKPLFPHDIAAERGYYGATGWTVADVHNMREQRGLPKVSDEDAEEWLESREDDLRDSMIRAGNDFLLFELE